MQDSRMEAHRWGKEGKELVRAPTSESKSAGVARAKASWDPPRLPHLELWCSEQVQERVPFLQTKKEAQPRSELAPPAPAGSQ